MILWDESLSVGVPEMDEEHKELIRMINRTQELLELGRQKDALEFFEEALVEYSETHLNDEEAFLERIGYPKLAEHKKQHELFRKKVLELEDAIKKGDLDGLQKAIDLSWAWLHRHITGADRDYGLYYQRHVLNNKSTLLKLAPVEEALKNIFTEFYFRLINTPHLAKFFRDAYQVSELIQKQVEFVKSYLYALDLQERDRLRDYFKEAAVRHAKLGINIDDMITYIDFLAQKLHLLRRSENLQGIKEEDIEEFIDFMKQQTYKAYFKNSIERSIENWKLHLELLGELASSHIETLRRLISAVDGVEFEHTPFSACSVTRYMSSARFFIQGYAVKEIVNMALITHQRFHAQLDEIVDRIMAGDFKKAYELSFYLVRDSDALEGFLLYIQLLWKKNPEENFFNFLMDPVNSDKIVGMILIPSEPTKNAKEIFSKFNSILVQVVNESNNPELFAFSHIDYQDDIYRGYVVHFSLMRGAEKKRAHQEILECYERAMERLGKEYNIEEVVGGFIKMVPLETATVLENFRLTKEELELFIDRIEKKTKNRYEFSFDTINDELVKIIYDVKREYRVFQKLLSLKERRDAPFLELYAQPIVSFETSKVVALEILTHIRLDSVNEPVSAAAFIDLVKKHKLTDDFDIAVLRKVEETLRSLSKPLDYTLFINLFPSSYLDLEVDKMVQELSVTGEKKTKGIVFEVTEQENYDMDSIVKTFQRYGAKIAIDDFGSGYSNFDKFISLMRTENLKYIKVDGGLVKNVLKDEVYKKSLRHIYSLTKEFGKQIVFEFIENEQIEKELRSISQNSALGQGYHYGRPKPLSEYIRD